MKIAYIIMIRIGLAKSVFIYTLGAAALVAGCGEQPQSENQEEPQESPAQEVVVHTGPAHWSYEAKDGPAVWGSLDPVYKLCGEGQSQSPINIVDANVAAESGVSINYAKTGIHMAFNEHVEELVDNGHTIQLNVDEGSTLNLDGKAYALKQFHFHTPSEHTINGEHMPLEIHFVHQDEAGHFAVLGVLVAEGAKNTNIGSLISNLPQTKGDTVHVDDAALDLNMHLPENSAAYLYTGSLTTPPCSEDVHWLVLKQHPEMSKSQIEAISNIIGPNNRPVQEINGRQVKSGGMDEGQSVE